MRPAAGTGEHHVGVDLDGARCEGEQGKRGAVVLAEKPDSVQRRGPNVQPRELREGGRRLEQRCVDGGLGKRPSHGQNDLLRPAALCQVIVGDRDTDAIGVGHAESACSRGRKGCESALLVFIYKPIVANRSRMELGRVRRRMDTRRAPMHGGRRIQSVPRRDCERMDTILPRRVIRSLSMNIRFTDK